MKRRIKLTKQKKIQKSRIAAAKKSTKKKA
jgi:hypothetical protein